jgi:tRNA(fMet)-specific endonuclease VapC
MLLDTSFLIDFFRGVEATRNLVGGEPLVSAISYHEIMTGIRFKRATVEEKHFKRFFGEVRILAYDTASAEESNSIAAKLLVIGKNVNALDIMIAGSAQANGVYKIATRDAGFLEIQKVSDLRAVRY